MKISGGFSTNEEELLLKNCKLPIDKPRIILSSGGRPYIEFEENDFIDNVDVRYQQYTSGIYITINMQELIQYNKMYYSKSNTIKVLSQLKEKFEQVTSRYIFKMPKIDTSAFDYLIVSQMLWESLVEVLYCREGIYGFKR